MTDGGPTEDRPKGRPHAEPWLVVTMALSGWAHRARRVVVPPWTVDPSLVPDLVDLALAWQPWAARVDHARTSGDVGDSNPSWRVELERRKLDRSYYPHGRHLDDRRVPDACVEQVLTGAHLDAARDLSRWQVEQVATDRYAVTHPEPSSWFLPAQDGRPGTRVDPDVLDRARDDFGAMILGPRDL